MAEQLPDVAVWHYGRQEFVPHFPCPGEKRVRIDVHDSLDDYDVFPVTRPDGQQPFQSGIINVISQTPLADWRIDLS